MVHRCVPGWPSHPMAAAGLLAVLAVPLPAQAAPPCYDYGQATREAGSVHIGAGADHIEVEAGLAYVAVGTLGLVIVDVTRPDEPRVLGAVDTPGGPSFSANSVAVQGPWAYVADGASGLQVIDVSDPRHPRIAGRIAPGEASSVAVSGSYAYVALRRGLQVVDVSRPEAPRSVAYLLTWSRAYGIALAGRYAYLAGSAGLQVVDIGDPLHPELLATIQGWGSDVAVLGERAYLVGSRLRVYDIATPASPRLLGETSAPLYIDEVAVRGSVVCTLGSGGLHFADVSDPARPTWIQDVSFVDAAFGLDIEVGFAYVAAPGKVLHVLRVPRLDRLVRGVADTPGGAVGVAGQGRYAYLADGEQGLAIVDVQDVDAPRLLASLPLPGFAQNLHAAGSTVYIASRAAGVHVVDVSDLSNPGIAGSLDTPGDALDVAAVGSLAYVADGTAGVQVIDASAPGAPLFVQSLDTPGPCTGLFQEDDRLYVADGFYGVRILDISTQPASWAGSVPLPSYAQDISIRDRVLWIADPWGTVFVFDVGDAAQPLPLARFRTPDATALAQDDRAVYLACGSKGVLVIDSTTPAAPRILGAVRPPASATAVGVGSDRVLVAAGDSGLATLLPHCRIATPVAVRDLEAVATRSGVLVRWYNDSASPGPQRILRAGDGDPDFAAIAVVAVPASGPREYLDDTVVAGRYAYAIAVFSPGAGEVIVGPVHVMAQPAALDLSAPFPNPMRDGTTVRVRTPSGSRSRVAVYDVAGRLVRELAQPGAPARSVSWDGRDGRGAEVAPGVYLLRLEAGGRALSRRVTRVR